MMSWVVDHAVLLYVLLGCVFAAFAAAWWLTRKKPHLVAAGVVLGLIVLVWLLTFFTVTDRQRIEQVIREMAQGVGANKPDDVVKHLSRDFSYGSIDRKAAGAYMSENVQRYGITNVHAWDFDFEKLSREEGKAKVGFLVRIDMGGSEYPFRCRSDFVLEDEQWRMKTFRLTRNILNTTEPTEIPPP